MEVCVTFKKTQILLKLLFSKRIIISSFTLCVTSFLRKEKRGGGIGGFRDSGFFYEKKIKYTFFIFLYTEMT